MIADHCGPRTRQTQLRLATRGRAIRQLAIALGCDTRDQLLAGSTAAFSTSALLIQQQRLEPDMILQGLVAKVILSSLRAGEILSATRDLCEGVFSESVIPS